MINLILAVIMGSFSKFESREIEERIKQAENQELLHVSKNINTSSPRGHSHQREKESHHRQIGKDKMNSAMKIKPISNFKKGEQPLRGEVVDLKFDISESVDHETSSIRESSFTSSNEEQNLDSVVKIKRLSEDEKKEDNGRQFKEDRILEEHSKIEESIDQMIVRRRERSDVKVNNLFIGTKNLAASTKQKKSTLRSSKSFNPRTYMNTVGKRLRNNSNEVRHSGSAERRHPPAYELSSLAVNEATAPHHQNQQKGGKSKNHNSNSNSNMIKKQKTIRMKYIEKLEKKNTSRFDQYQQKQRLYSNVAIAGQSNATRPIGSSQAPTSPHESKGESGADKHFPTREQTTSPIIPHKASSKKKKYTVQPFAEKHVIQSSGHDDRDNKIVMNTDLNNLIFDNEKSQDWQ